MDYEIKSVPDETIGYIDSDPGAPQPPTVLTTTPVEYEISDGGKIIGTMNGSAPAGPGGNTRTKEEIAHEILLRKMVGLANLRNQIRVGKRQALLAQERNVRVKKSRKKRQLEKMSRKRNRR